MIQFKYTPLLVLVLSIIAFSACQPTSKAQITELPEGGLDVIGTDTFAALKGSSSSAVKLETINVTDQGFSQAWRVTGLQPVEQPYSSQLSADNVLAISKDDTMIVQFWARSVSSKAAQTEFVFEQNTDPYAKSVGVGVTLTPQWIFYSVPFKAVQDYPVGTAAARFRLGYNNQSFELGGVILKNYAKTKTVNELPFSGIGYVGRELDAAWRSAADARIDQLRKTNLRVNLKDSNGKPISNATIKLEMQRHAFPFGTAVDAEKLLGTSQDSATYKAKILELFNRVVLENDLKWPVWECCRKTQALEAIKLFAANNISVRGHNLIWPCNDNYCLPDDVPALFSDTTKLKARIDSHLVDILGATKGTLVEWDVVNEPSANKRLSNVLGEDEMVAQFKRAKELDGNAKMFVNDYGNLGEGNLDTEFKRIIKRLLELGAPVEGIGLQAHFGLQLTPPEELNSRLDAFGAFGLPLAITEFDVNTSNESLQADYLRDFLTIAFANKNVSSFLMWGFWEGQHWLPDAALYRKDWSIKPNGQVFKDLLFKTWWTNATGASDATGKFETRGFYGDYKITATLGSRIVTKTVKLEPNSTGFDLILP
jgi:endo-1,4-beta-xylanase